jgi:putative ABC transport system permease protein
MNTTDFGLLLVTKEGFANFDENTITYRYSYVFKDNNLSDADEKALIDDMQKILLEDNATLQSFLTAEANQAITFLRNDMGKDGPVMKVFVYILIMIIAFVFAILTNNTIESEASIIGTLRASGYKKSEIISHYLMPTIIIAFVSSVVGNLLGYTVMLEPFKELYYGTYSLAPLDVQFNAEAFITTTILPVVIMIFINWWMLHSKLSLTPLKFLRKDLHKKKQKKAVKLPDFKFLTRFRLRVLIQNKVSYIILFVGIFLSSFLLMFGIGMDPLIDNYVDEIDDSVTYEYQYILKAPIEIENAEKLMTNSLKTWFELGQMDMSVSFMGISENSEFFKGIELPNDRNEITISQPLAEKLNLKEGDEIVFKDDYYDKEYTLKVKNICEYKGSLNVFMKMELLNELLGNEAGTFNAYLSNEKLDIDNMYLAKYITRADMVGAAKEMMKSFEGILGIINVFSVIIYMILMYILTKTVIEKNAIPISFMKVFGYNNKEIGKLYLNATTITVMISLLVCIPVEALCFKYILVYIGSMIEGHIPFYLPMWVYIAIIVIGILAYFAINALHVRKVRRIHMSEAMKNRE